MPSAMNWWRWRRLLATAWRSIRRRPLRSLLSVLGVVCGVIAVLAMVAVGEGARRQTLEEIGRMGTRTLYVRWVLPETGTATKSPDAPRPLDVQDLARIGAGSPSVRQVTGLVEIQAPLAATERNASAQVVACGADLSRIHQLPIVAGRFIGDADLEQRQMVCVLGEDLALRLGPQGQPGASLRIGELSFRVIGVLARRPHRQGRGATVSMRNYNEMVFIPLGTQRDLLSGALREAQPMALTEIAIQVADEEQVRAAAATVRRILEARRGNLDGLQLVIPLELMRQLQRTRSIFAMVLASVAAISLLVGGVGVMNVMLATVSERRREIGIRRALGATPGHISAQFLGEAVLLTAAGGLIGVGLGSVLVVAVAAAAGWPAAITPWGMIVPLVTATAVGIASGLYPARQAARLDPIEALRQGG